MTLASRKTVNSQRRDTLRWLARNWDHTGDTVREFALNDIAHLSLGPLRRCSGCHGCLACLWDSYRGHLALADGIDRQPWAGPVEWHDINPDLTCASRTEAACEEIWERVAGDEDALLRGRGVQR